MKKKIYPLNVGDVSGWVLNGKIICIHCWGLPGYPERKKGFQESGLNVIDSEEYEKLVELGRNICSRCGNVF